jgi:hypothetical protein
MAKPGEYDHEYKSRIGSALMEAIMRASIDEKSNVCAIKNLEACEAMMQLMAFFMATSERLNSQTAIREHAEQFRKDYQRLLTAARKKFQEEGTPFPVVDDSQMH